MKKYIVILFALLLLGCTDDQSVYKTYEKSDKQLQEKVVQQTVSPNVTIHGASGVANGYVIDTDKQKKWIVTLASIVSGHPKSLIVTSTNQRVEGDIIALNKELNIAIISTKLTANISPYTLSTQPLNNEELDSLNVSEVIMDEQNQLQAIVSIVKKDGRFKNVFITSNEIKAIYTKAIDEPISPTERLALSKYFSDFPKTATEPNNLIDYYEKPTFTYNADEIAQFLIDFQKALNDYFVDKDFSTVEHFIVSDDLKKTIQQLANDSKNVKQFGSIKVKSVSVEEFQYVVEADTSLKAGEEMGELTAKFNIILMNGEWKLISVKYE